MISEKTPIHYLLLIIIMLSMVSCNNQPHKEKKVITDDPQQEFLKKLKQNNQKKIACNVIKSFSEKDPSPEYAEIRKNAEEEISITFTYTNGSTTTLIITRLEKELLLKHDVRQENLMPSENTMYGGFSKDQGTANHQVFPVHNFGTNMWPEYEASHWEIFWDEKNNELHYQEWNEDTINRHYVLLLGEKPDADVS